jgi:prevent-host-death family protein
MSRQPPAATSTRRHDGPPGTWRLQDAKARFSELVRRARGEGPQHVTVHGREQVVIISALIDAMRESPCQDIDIAPGRSRLPVRDVAL